MSNFEEHLGAELESLDGQNLRRRLRTSHGPQGRMISLEGRELLNFSSNDYLGLATHPALKEAATKAIEQYGAGSGASRLISGSLRIHHELEEALATWKGTEAALAFSTGYAAAMGTITALMKQGDIVIVDKLAHASIIDGIRLSGALLRVFKHNDVAGLEGHLQWASESHPEAKILVITESIFSMDGDAAPLREIVQLKDDYKAWLMVDEAHGCGLFGARRSGKIEDLGLTGRVEIQMGTLGKAVGSGGGFIAGSRTLIDYLLNKSRSFIFSTAPVPAQAGAALAGLEIIQGQEGAHRLQQLQQNLAALHSALPDAPTSSAIVPIHLGSEERALSASKTLLDRGFFIPAVRYPTVPRGKARLRLSLSAMHTIEDVAAVAANFTSPLSSAW